MLHSHAGGGSDRACIASSLPPCGNHRSHCGQSLCFCSPAYGRPLVSWVAWLMPSECIAADAFSTERTFNVVVLNALKALLRKPADETLMGPVPDVFICFEMP